MTDIIDFRSRVLTSEMLDSLGTLLSYVTEYGLYEDYEKNNRPEGHLWLTVRKLWRIFHPDGSVWFGDSGLLVSARDLDSGAFKDAQLD